MEEATRSNHISHRQGYVRNQRQHWNTNNRYNRVSQGYVQKRYHQPDMKYQYHRYPQENRRYARYNNRKKKKLASRSNSPDEGSEEYMNKKIQHTSAIIMRHLLSPEEGIIPIKTVSNNLNSRESATQKVESKTENKRKRNASTTESSVLESPQTSKNKKHSNYNVEEIHNKIMGHLTNLNDGRKKNLISNITSTYDDAIQQILKQKRLEISRALRSMCLKSSDITESTDLINSIIPDMGIKIEELPQEVLEALQSTFSNLENFEGVSESPSSCAKMVDTIIEIFTDTSSDSECLNSPNIDLNIETVNIKQEVMLSEDPSGDLLDAPILEGACVDSSWLKDEQELHIKKEIVEDNMESNVDNFSPTTTFDNLISDTNISQTNQPNEDILIPTFHLEPAKISEETTDLSLSNRTVKTPEEISETLPGSSDFLNIPHENSEPICYSNVRESRCEELTIEDFLQKNFRKPPKNYSEAVKRMFVIDQYINELTAYRQNLFTNLKTTRKNVQSSLRQPMVKKKKKTKKKNNSPNVTTDSAVNEQSQEKNENLNSIIDPTLEEQSNVSLFEKGQGNLISSNISKDEQRFMEFSNISEKILVLKVCEGRLLAATESGKIYFYSLKSGECENILNATSLPISSLAYKKAGDTKPYLFVGSCESSLKVYNLYSAALLRNFPLDDSVQCMDENWGYLFLGCLRGTLIRYNIKKHLLEDQEQFSSNPVFVLKATHEGARKVLLIGSRDSPVIIRDAMSGLHLRKLEIMYPTIYSMIMHKHFVICGTTKFDILVFNFYNGHLEHTFKATKTKGVACMKVVGNCLFASCHDGNIYIFNLAMKSLIHTLNGPGGVIISMEVLSNQLRCKARRENYVILFDLGGFKRIKLNADQDITDYIKIMPFILGWTNLYLKLITVVNRYCLLPTIWVKRISRRQYLEIHKFYIHCVPTKMFPKEEIKKYAQRPQFLLY